MPIYINATGEYLQRTASLPDSEVFTTCFLCRVVGSTATATLVEIEDEVSKKNRIEVSSNGHVFPSTEGEDGGAMDQVSDGATFWVAMVCDSAGFNGQWGYYAATPQAASLTKSDTLTNTAFTAANLTYGHDSGYCDAEFSCIKAWDAVLTEEELFAEMKHMWAPVRSANLHLWCPLIDETDVRDYSSQDRPLTKVGSPTEADFFPWGYNHQLPIIGVPVQSVDVQDDFSAAGTASAVFTPGVTVDGNVSGDGAPAATFGAGAAGNAALVADAAPGAVQSAAVQAVAALSADAAPAESAAMALRVSKSIAADAAPGATHAAVATANADVSAAGSSGVVMTAHAAGASIFIAAATAGEAMGAVANVLDSITADAAPGELFAAAVTTLAAMVADGAPAESISSTVTALASIAADAAPGESFTDVLTAIASFSADGAPAESVAAAVTSLAALLADGAPGDAFSELVVEFIPPDTMFVVRQRR